MSEICEYQIERSFTSVSEGITSLSLSGVYLEWRKRIQPLVLIRCNGSSVHRKLTLCAKNTGCRLFIYRQNIALRRRKCQTVDGYFFVIYVNVSRFLVAFALSAKLVLRLRHQIYVIILKFQ